MNDRASARLERVLGRVLRVGMIAATVLLAGGLLLQLAGLDPRLATRLMHGGLIVLMATPVARVVVSVVDFALARDRLFLVLTATVLLILLGSLVVAVR